MKAPHLRITIELVDEPPPGTDLRVAGITYDHGRIIGDGFLNGITRRYSFDVNSCELFFGIGWEANSFRSAADAINQARNTSGLKERRDENV